jgi:hypothetical protein
MNFQTFSQVVRVPRHHGCQAGLSPRSRLQAAAGGDGEASIVAALREL